MWNDHAHIMAEPANLEIWFLLYIVNSYIWLGKQKIRHLAFLLSEFYIYTVLCMIILLKNRQIFMFYEKWYQAAILPWIFMIFSEWHKEAS